MWRSFILKCFASFLIIYNMQDPWFFNSIFSRAFPYQQDVNMVQIS